MTEPEQLPEVEVHAEPAAAAADATEGGTAVGAVAESAAGAGGAMDDSGEETVTEAGDDGLDG